MQIQSPRQRRRIVSLTPLIDVVFILLIFFMLASTFVQWRAIDLGLTQAGGASSQMEGAILVRVRPERLDLNGRPLSLAELSEAVKGYLSRRPRQSVVIQPGQGVDLQRIVDVADRLVAAGATNLSLQGGSGEGALP